MKMHYYKDKTNKVWVYDNEQIREGWVRDGLLKITESEANKILFPEPTKEQLIEQAESKKQLLITEANQKTQLWQTQLMLDIITDEDKASLTEWMLYVQKVQTVDTSAAPDIIWPEKPE
ncbi:phage tail protein [Morganella morganii]|uniref:tail fiber assembly protein n=1 Tax=Morganella morganii TaxID=582 RepID=UPI000E2311E8|nr:tail fiber assembly protein [Morganella morganii]REL20478.1 phage tail protein [Morganella morganii]